ncbi:MAG: hypothetical protein IKX21_02610, partial [Deltaproteobacteria bacterium]|nr:hypothetical protein [Deltaproteobacteria bacterium]
MKLTHPSLEGADFALVHFKLRMVERSLFTAQLLLGMRAGLLKAARRLESVKGQPYADLVDPQVDFHEAHQHQKPAPAFVLVPPAEIPLEVAARNLAQATPDPARRYELDMLAAEEYFAFSFDSTQSYLK